MNTVEDFEAKVELHSLAPGNIFYNGVGMGGEAGEVLNVLKKMEIIRVRPEWNGRGISPMMGTLLTA